MTLAKESACCTALIFLSFAHPILPNKIHHQHTWTRVCFQSSLLSADWNIYWLNSCLHCNHWTWSLIQQTPLHILFYSSTRHFLLDVGPKWDWITNCGRQSCPGTTAISEHSLLRSPHHSEGIHFSHWKYQHRHDCGICARSRNHIRGSQSASYATGYPGYTQHSRLHGRDPNEGLEGGFLGRWEFLYVELLIYVVKSMIGHILTP